MTLKYGSCLKTGQHFIFVIIIYLLLPIKCIILDSVSKILFIFLLPIIIRILILKILLHNVHKIIILRYPTYVYQFRIFLIITKIECWPVFKQDPIAVVLTWPRAVRQSISALPTYNALCTAYTLFLQESIKYMNYVRLFDKNNPVTWWFSYIYIYIYIVYTCQNLKLFRILRRVYI